MPDNLKTTIANELMLSKMMAHDLRVANGKLRVENAKLRKQRDALFQIGIMIGIILSIAMIYSIKN